MTKTETKDKPVNQIKLHHSNLNFMTILLWAGGLGWDVNDEIEILQELAKHNFDKEWISSLEEYYKDKEDFINDINKESFYKDDVIFIKASNSCKFGDIFEALKEKL